MKKKTTKGIKVWVTVSDWAKMPTTYGEYFKKKPKHYYNIKEARLIITPQE